MMPRHWLRLYTDTALLLSIAEVVALSSSKKTQRIYGVEEKDLNTKSMKAIRRLDMALIVAGAIGRGRKEWILQTIRQLQELIVVHQEDTNAFDRASGKDSPNQNQKSDRPAKRQRLRNPNDGPCSLRKLRCAPTSIPILSTPPSIDEYLQHHSQQPFILRGYLSTDPDDGIELDSCCPPPWPAIDRWRSAEYLRETAGKGRVVPVEVGGAYVDESWTQKIIPFDDFLQVSGFNDASSPLNAKTDGESDINSTSKDKGKREPSSGPATEADSTARMPTQPLYLAQYALFDQFPDLAKDISYPDYVWSEPSIPLDYPTYRPPQTEDGVIVNVWVGSGGGEIVSPAHTDPYYNCYAQVVGQKRVWLAPPKCGPYMHAYGTKGQSKINAATTDPGSDLKTDTLADQYMTNTSKIPIFRHKGDFVKDLESAYPDFFAHVWPESLEAVLMPGDLLVMPPGWWHAMTGEGDGPGWSVSMWY
ncbi:hypothetical protein IAU59_003651 [Kwoniella sp. CBS 9459]